MFASKRLAKELSKMHDHLPPGISIALADDLETWYMDIKVLDGNPIYANEEYRLKFKFSSSYPIGMCNPDSCS